LLRQGDQVTVEQVLEQALKIETTTLEQGHPNTGITAGNLALIYRVQGRFAQAEPLLKRALAVNLKASGPRSVEVAVSSFLLAPMYHVQGRDSEAEASFRRGRSIELHLPPTSRADMVIALQDYVDLFRSLRRFDAANELETRVAPIKRRQKT
jgi:tetratricopeptide (TPR) repeat protein